MAAAVSDYVPAFVQDGKMKKDVLGETFELSLKKNIDILSSIDKSGISVVGFKAEMDVNAATANATTMLKNKNLDAVCLNVLKDASSFGTDTNAIDFITKEETHSIPLNDKLSVGFSIAEYAQRIEE